jgi:nucleotide-binding universal stress UspA family protein
VATLLYPTRGGDTAYRNQDRACELAKELGADILLLYVGNVSFLDTIAGPVHVDVVQKELDEMAEFLLAVAKERVEKSGVKAKRVLKHGAFREALIETIQEYGVTAVVLGRPAHDKALTTSELISSIAESIATDLLVETFVVHEGEIVEHYQPTTAEDTG